MIGLAIGLGVASGAFSALSASSANSANAAAQRRQNAAIKMAADQTLEANLFQNDYTFRQNRGNIGSQNKAFVEAMAATNSARGITGSRVASALKTNANEQSFMRFEDLSVTKYLADLEARIKWANTLNQRGGYQGQSTGLMLLGAGISGLQTGLSTYQSFGGSTTSTPSTPPPE